jgi:hypothetical protein
MTPEQIEEARFEIAGHPSHLLADYLRMALDALVVAQGERDDLVAAWPKDPRGVPVSDESIPKLTQEDNGGMPFCGGCGARLS